MTIAFPPNWFPHADGWLLLCLGLIAGHWLPRLAWTIREKRRLQRRLAASKGRAQGSIVPIRRRGG